MWQSIFVTHTSMATVPWMVLNYTSHTATYTNSKAEQGAQLMQTNPRDAFRGQSRSPNIVGLPIDMLDMVSYHYERQKLKSLQRRVRSKLGHVT